MSELLRLVFAVSEVAASQNISDYRKADATVAVDGCYVSLYRFALCLTASHSRAADLVRRTLLSFSRWRHQTQDYSRIERCLFTILHRCHLEMRSRTDCPQAEFNNPLVNDPECLDLPAALAQVDEARRAALSLFYQGNFSVSDIAHILELPVDTAMSKLSKGREQLRSILKGPSG